MKGTIHTFSSHICEVADHADGLLWSCHQRYHADRTKAKQNGIVTSLKNLEKRTILQQRSTFLTPRLLSTLVPSKNSLNE